ncbi:predicted protein [Streptomyces viridosporus ATCC 14672]|uniref:Predicted protein n=1 Tax=Streptomyces viridosporus (strain ATCC 14672 / DSM 40746 / JCM 4963 / KCTC 9882 / NRRL B-12104 / FH 1290) TaxID=566461 RepID=D6A6V4_STRV1|nr:predicted protein [Streptomyces viridosporus ATCC 14672]
MIIIFISVSGASPIRRRDHSYRTETQLMEQNQVFTPIAEQGQLAHLSATHSNALVENPFDDAVEADADK